MMRAPCLETMRPLGPHCRVLDASLECASSVRNRSQKTRKSVADLGVLEGANAITGDFSKKEMHPGTN